MTLWTCFLWVACATPEAPSDGGPRDARAPDAGEPDAGRPDAGSDAGSDAGARDAGENDGGRPEFDGSLQPNRFVEIPAFGHVQWDETWVVPCYLEASVQCEAMEFAGGVAATDIDLDGDLDLFFGVFDDDDRFYRNDEGEFVPDTLPGVTTDSARLTNGAAFADIDEDGTPELYVGTIGEDRAFLFRRPGPGEPYVEIAEASGVALAGAPTTMMSVCFGDDDLDGDLDLFTTEWRPGIREADEQRNRLFRNEGGGAPPSFVDATAAAGLDLFRPDLRAAYGFGVRWHDLNGDGYPELFFAGDFETSHLYVNQGDGTYLDETSSRDVGSDENAMGQAIGDIDFDGDLDWFVTGIYAERCPLASGECNFSVRGNRLFRNDGDHFTDITDEAGVRDAGWAWGAVFFDYDLDQDLDLVVANGAKLFGPTSPWESDALRLYENDGTGHFTDVAVARGIADRTQTRGILPLDVEGDGDLDLVVTRPLEAPSLFRNDLAGGTWLQVRAEGGAGTHPEGRGAIVRVRATPDGPEMLRTIGDGCHFLANEPGWAHFGLGGASRVARVEVFFPASGRSAIVEDIPADQILVVRESAL